MNEQLAKITCRPDQAQELIKLGILPKSIFWQCYEDQDTQPKDSTGKPVKKWNKAYYLHPQYRPDEMVPAWTMEEINAFLGPDTLKIDFESTAILSHGDRENKKNGVYIPIYVVYKPEKATNYYVGAQAAADWLIYLIGTFHSEHYRKIFIQEANNRYKLIFKP